MTSQPPRDLEQRYRLLHGEPEAARALARRIKRDLAVAPYVVGQDQEVGLDWLM